MRLNAVEPLAQRHVLTDFSSGLESVDSWLVRNAVRNQAVGASRVFVAADDDGAVGAYYTLSNGSLLRRELPRAARHGSPAVAPVLLIGQFGVDARYQGQGVGAALLRDALGRCARVAQETGFMFVLVNPDGAAATSFWTKFGFRPAPGDGHILLLALTDLARFYA